MIEGHKYRLNNPDSERNGKICMVVKICPATVILFWPDNEKLSHHVHAVRHLLKMLDSEEESK